MSFDQVNPDFNDALQIYYPSTLSWWQEFLRLATARTCSSLLKMQRHICGGTRLINERIVEYAQVLRWMPSSGVVLDVGCVSSRFPLQLASLGYRVYGIDVRPYPIASPGFEFHRADIFGWSPPVRFDVITAISTIEHFGGGRYGDVSGLHLDQVLVQRLHGWLQPGGLLLVSVPFGRAGHTPVHQVYDSKGLETVFAGFRTLDSRFFRRDGSRWMPCVATDLLTADPHALPVLGVACLQLAVNG